MLFNKKSIITSVLMVSILGTSQIKVSADNSKEYINLNTSVEMTEDARVAPIDNVDELSEHQLNLILDRIGYSEESINKWPLNRKRTLVSYGGRSVDTEEIEFVHTYTSTDGNDYVVTPENEEEIKEIQINDLEKMGIQYDQKKTVNLVEDNTSILSTYSADSFDDNYGYKQDGIWSGEVIVAYIGETSHQHKYYIGMDFYWDEKPLANYGELLGLYWGSYGQPVANTGAGYFAFQSNISNNWATWDFNPDLSSTQGITAEFSFPRYILGQSMGSLGEEILVSKDLSGHILAVAGRYVHPYAPNNWGFSIGAAGVSLSGALTDVPKDNWTWTYNFTAF